MIIGVWGDSVAYGSCDEEALGWVGRVRKRLAPETDDHGVLNFSFPGETSAGLVGRFKQEFDAIIFKPEIVIFAVGLNDAVVRGDNAGPDVPLEEFGKNIEALIKQCEELSVKTILLGPNNVDESRANPFIGSSTGKKFTNEVVLKYNDSLRKIGAQKHIDFVDIFNLLDVSELADGVHPNAKGYEKIYNEAIKSI